MQIPDAPTTVQNSLLSICLFAVFADGEKSEAEQEMVRKIGDDLGSENVSDLTRRILMRKLSLDDAVAGLASAQDRVLAYEMALSVCEAGGSLTTDEREFLQSLREKLSLEGAEVQRVEQEVASVSGQRVNNPPPLPVPGSQGTDHSELILKYAILNGALELLPETMATMAIVPLQMKMVYSIGKSHGIELGREHIKEFLVIAGAGLGLQVVEGFARQLIRGLTKKMAGKWAGAAADQVTGSAFSFASTYAIGFVADQYYRGGRKLEQTQLRETFASWQKKAREIHSNYLPQIRERAGSLNTGNILSLIKDTVTGGRPGGF